MLWFSSALLKLKLAPDAASKQTIAFQSSLVGLQSLYSAIDQLYICIFNLHLELN